MFSFLPVRPSRSARKTCRKTALQARPCSHRASLEALEQRTVLSAVSWINPAGGAWDVASNWSTGTVPTFADDVTIDTAATATITIHQSSNDVRVNSINTGANDELLIDGSTFLVSAASTLDGPLSMTGGWLMVEGPGVDLVANGSTSISGANLYANSGGRLSLPHLTSYTSIGSMAVANENTIDANGAGSVVDLPALATVTLNGSFGIFATGGGKVNLSSLASLSGNTNPNDLSFYDVGNSTILDGSLTSLDMTYVKLDGTDQQVANSWTKCTNSLLYVTGGSNTLGGLTDIDGSSVYVQNGASLSLPGVTSYAADGSTFQASGAGSVLNMAALGNLTIENNWTASAENGGDVKLDALTVLPAQQAAQISAQGSGSVVELTSLTTFYAPKSDIAVGNDGTVVLGGQTFTMPSSRSGGTIAVPEFPLQCPITLTSSGTFYGVIFDIALNDQVSVANGTITGGVTFQTAMNSTVDLTGGNQVSYSGFLINNGSGIVQLNSGRIIVGAGGVTLTNRGGGFLWTGGGFDTSSGNVTNLGYLALSGPGDKYVTGGGMLDDAGIIVQNGAGNLNLLGDNSHTATLKIERSGSYTLESSAGVKDAPDAPGAIINEGTIAKTAGSGDSAFSISLVDNTGSINLPAGIGLSITGDFINSYSLTLDLGSTLTVGGNFTEASTSIIVDPIGGTPVSGQFGKIIVGKHANLDGGFALHFVNGFIPSAGQDFKLMTFASASGNFVSDFSAMLFDEHVNSTSFDLTTMAATPHQRFVTAVYEDVLGRESDSGGLVRWSLALDLGASIGDVAQAIAHSDEYYINFVIKPDYLKLLGRAADDGAVTYWTAKMQAGLTDQKFEAGLIASDEFYKAAENFDSAPDADDTSIADTDQNTDWVDAVYKLLLGRTADAGGEAYWTKQLASGVSRGDVALAIAGGAENNSQLINADYFHYLGRAADPDGLNYWLEQFAAGKTNEDVIAGFTGSLEYYEKHTN